PSSLHYRRNHIQQSRQRPLADFTGFRSTGTCSWPPQLGMCTPPVPAPAAACPSPYPLNLETLLRTPIALAAFADLSLLLMQCSPRTTHDAVEPNSPSHGDRLTPVPRLPCGQAGGDRCSPAPACAAGGLRAAGKPGLAQLARKRKLRKGLSQHFGRPLQKKSASWAFPLIYRGDNQGGRSRERRARGAGALLAPRCGAARRALHVCALRGKGRADTTSSRGCRPEAERSPVRRVALPAQPRSRGPAQPSR
ncbi:hypothetical protein EI555_016310, partial [Monodon monoceros]